METIITKSGDTWDKIAKRVYGKEILLDALIRANFEHRKTVIFRDMVVLNVPEIDSSKLVNADNLPPWKR